MKEACILGVLSESARSLLLVGVDGALVSFGMGREREN